MKGEGPGRQGSGSADSGRGEVSGGHGEILILVMAGKWRNSVFPASKFVVKFNGEIFVLVLRTFEPPPKSATDPPPQISPRLWQKFSGQSQLLICSVAAFGPFFG